MTCKASTKPFHAAQRHDKRTQRNSAVTKIIVYPTAYGFNVLANWPHPAVTHDAAWRPAHEIQSAKVFPDETAAKSYIARHFPQIPMANFVIRDPE